LEKERSRKMRLQDNDIVMYESESTIDPDGIPNVPTVLMKILHVKKSVMDGIQFIDENNILRYNYRVRKIMKEKEFVDNCCYDFLRIAEETDKILKTNICLEKKGIEI
jgi:hypothetical protein